MPTQDKSTKKLSMCIKSFAKMLIYYGFRSEGRKSSFSAISVSGIGPVSALAIFAADDNEPRSSY